MKKIIKCLVVFFLIASYSKAQNKSSQEFIADQKAFTQSLAMILKANADAYKNMDAVKAAPNDTALIMKSTADLTKSYNEIINESQKVSDRFLEYIDPEFKTKYQDLINTYKTLTDKSQLQNLNADDAKNLDKNISTVEESFWNYFQEHQSEINKKLPSIEQDFKDAMRKYNVPTELTTELIKEKGIKKSYWGLFWRLGVGDIAITFIFSLLVVILMYKTILIAKAAEKLNSFGTILLIPFSLIGFIAQGFLWIIWAAFCAFSVKYFIDSPTVTQNWLYYATGFFASWGPLNYLSVKEQDTAETTKERNKIVIGSFIYIILIIVSFILFCIYPNLMSYKFISFIYEWVY